MHFSLFSKHCPKDYTGKWNLCFDTSSLVNCIYVNISTLASCVGYINQTTHLALSQTLTWRSLVLEMNLNITTESHFDLLILILQLHGHIGICKDFNAKMHMELFCVSVYPSRWPISLGKHQKWVPLSDLEGVRLRRTKNKMKLCCSCTIEGSLYSVI